MTHGLPPLSEPKEVQPGSLWGGGMRLERITRYKLKYKDGKKRITIEANAGEPNMVHLRVFDPEKAEKELDDVLRL